MLTAYLATCEAQEADHETLLKMWNEIREATGKPAPSYGSWQSAQSALSSALAEARRELAKLHNKAFACSENGEAADKYTFLPKHQERIVFLHPRTVRSDVAEFRALLTQIKRAQQKGEPAAVLMPLLEQAKHYEGDFIQNGDFYFGRADGKSDPETPARKFRPWIAGQRDKLRREQGEVQHLLRQHTHFLRAALPTALDTFVPLTLLVNPYTSWLLEAVRFPVTSTSPTTLPSPSYTYQLTSVVPDTWRYSGPLGPCK